jgi:hypothetical protein
VYQNRLFLILFTLNQLNFLQIKEKKMRKLLGFLFAFAMILSLAFVGEAFSPNSSSVLSQTQTRRQTGRVVVRRKRTGGVVGATARGTRYVAHKTKRAAKYTAHKVKRGTIYTAHKTAQGTRYAAHKTKRGTKAAYRGTKKVLVGH